MASCTPHMCALLLLVALAGVQAATINIEEHGVAAEDGALDTCVNNTAALNAILDTLQPFDSVLGRTGVGGGTFALSSS